MTLIMGVVNVTPDSFSDGGRYADVATAVAHGTALVADGADLLDIGGESTRPGAVRPEPDEELRRVLPVVRELVGLGVPISVDTMRARVAAAVIEAGASVVNDVSGGVEDPDMARVVADAGVTYIAMHWRGHSADWPRRSRYADVVAEVCQELTVRRTALVAAGVRPEQIVLDPGLGFAKEAGHNWALLRRLDAVQSLGQRVLVGASRKRFLTRVEESAGRGVRAFDDSDPETAAVSVICALAGIWCVRVHDVALTRRELAVARAVLAGVTAAGPADDSRPDSSGPDPS